MLTATITDKAGLLLVGMDTRFKANTSPDSNASIVIPALWERFVAREGAIKNKTGHEFYGAVFRVPAEKKNHEAEMEYMAGVAVSKADADEIPDGMMAREVPAATMAVFIHKGSLDALPQTIRAIYEAWLPQSGYVHTNGPDVECYDQRFKPGSADSEFEIWIPIKKS